MQLAKYELKNPLARGLAGSIAIRAPRKWNLRPANRKFKLSSAEAKSFDFEVRLDPSTNSGKQPLQIDAVLKDTPFSIYREMKVGLGDITVELTTSIDNAGNLIVEQVMNNRSDKPVSFTCRVYAPQRRRQTAQIIDLARGQTTRRYRFRRGEQLVGRTISMRAQEVGVGRKIEEQKNSVVEIASSPEDGKRIGGKRILNFSIA